MQKKPLTKGASEPKVQTAPLQKKRNSEAFPRRCVIQRVTRASVTVDQELVGQIGLGFMVLVGVQEGDTEADAVPFTDPEAQATFWFVCKAANRERFGRLFAALERQAGEGE